MFYEEYPGSINDVAQLQIMIGKAAGYGYKDVGFILDRGYFSEPNIHYMDHCGYDFVIMVKGMKPFVHELVLKHRGMFEQKRANSIRDYKVSGMTVRQKLFASDEKERYFHIYYSDRKHAAERETVETKIDKLASFLRAHQGEKLNPGSGIEKYFELIYHNKGQENEHFVLGRERTDVIDREIALCGYFVLITSQKMTAEEALELYKGRDTSEKLFRGDKSYLGNRSTRGHTNESVSSFCSLLFSNLL